MPTITSTANRHIVDARKLRQRKHREEQGVFLLEGLQLLTMALDAGLTPVRVFYCPGQFAGPQAPALLERFARTRASAELLQVTPQVMAALSDREGPQGIVATFPLFTVPTPAPALTALELTGQELVVVLDRPQDPGNLGGLIRTADAVGAAGVVILEPAVDLFDPKAIRASMGSIFNLPVVLTPDAPAALGYLSDKGITPTGASEHAAALQSDPWGAIALRGGCALVLGNEARGLSADVTPLIRRWVSLPMRGKAESLNVSVAGGILMYLWLRASLPLGNV
jgi:TrmH family RNA methyltransferase